MSDIEQGTVKFYNVPRAFGFINPDFPGDAVYISGRALEHAGLAEVAAGDRVAFRKVCGPDGRWRARDLRLLQAGETL